MLDVKIWLFVVGSVLFSELTETKLSKVCFCAMLFTAYRSSHIWMVFWIIKNTNKINALSACITDCLSGDMHCHDVKHKFAF